MIDRALESWPQSLHGRLAHCFPSRGVHGAAERGWACLASAGVSARTLPGFQCAHAHALSTEEHVAMWLCNSALLSQARDPESPVLCEDLTLRLNSSAVQFQVQRQQSPRPGVFIAAAAAAQGAGPGPGASWLLPPLDSPCGPPATPPSPPAAPSLSQPPPVPGRTSWPSAQCTLLLTPLLRQVFTPDLFLQVFGCRE